jgi:hypothetical protein
MKKKVRDLLMTRPPRRAQVMQGMFVNLRMETKT